MVTVDSKGRIVLPKELRERLGLTAGTEVTVDEEGDHLVVERERGSSDVLARMEELVEETEPESGETRPMGDDPGSQALRHREIVQNAADRDTDDDA